MCLHHVSFPYLYLFLLLLWCFDNSRVRFPGFAKVVEQSQGVYQEGHMDSGKREMCNEVKEKQRWTNSFLELFHLGSFKHRSINQEVFTTVTSYLL